MRKLPRTRNIWKSEILLQYLHNLSEETIFRSKKIKEQHGTMKLQNEKLCSETFKTFTDKLNRPGSQRVHTWETSQKEAIRDHRQITLVTLNGFCLLSKPPPPTPTHVLNGNYQVGWNTKLNKMCLFFFIVFQILKILIKSFKI